MPRRYGNPPAIARPSGLSVGPVRVIGVAMAPAAAAAFFDLDKTVIARSSTFAFSRPLYQGGLINRRTVLRSAYAHVVFLLAGADHDQMERMRDYISSMVAGWEVQQVREIVAETLVDLIEPAVYREAIVLIDAHHAAGRDVVIVSASGAELVEPIAGMLGADDVIATQMVVEDGRYTGEVSFYAYGEHKAAAIREVAAARGYRLEDSYAYSDSVTDIPMLSEVGHPVAVNPDRALRREAAVRGWPVLDFNQPAPLRRRLPGQDAPPAALVAVAVGATAVSAALAWSAVRSRRTGVRKPPSRGPRHP